MASKPVFILCFTVAYREKPWGFILYSCRVWEKYPDERETECVSAHVSLGKKQLQLVPVDWMRNTACSLMPCFLEYCHPDVQNRPLVGEGWVVASPLRGLFLQGHTHARSEAHTEEAVAHGGSICSASLVRLHTAHPTGPKTLWLSGWQQVVKLAQRPIEEHVFSRGKLEHENHQNWNLRDFHPTRRINPFFQVDLSEV